MRIAFSPKNLLLAIFLYASAQLHDSVASSESNFICYSSKNAKTRLEYHVHKGKSYVVWLSRDTTVSPDTEPTGVDVVGEVKGVAVILTDTYPSIPGSMSYCQAGEERFLRIISIFKKPAEEVFHLKVESCRDDIELASPGLEWSPESMTLHIQWLLGPTVKGRPETRSIRIESDGTVR